MKDLVERVSISVVFHLELIRCTKGLVLGDLLYTTTLMPGERVRIATRDRTSSFSYDSVSNTAQYSVFVGGEESFLNNMSTYLGTAVGSSWGSATSGSFSTFSANFDNPGIGAIWGADAGVSSISSALAFSQFANGFSQMAATAHHNSAHAVRSTRATSISAVAVSKHTEGESESHYEASDRFFENPNSCHAVTYLFHRIDKKQTVVIKLTGITIEVGGTSASFDLPAAVIDSAIKKKIEELVKSGVIKPPKDSGELVPTDQARQSFAREFESRLPTDGIMVRACLDECSACEPQRKQRIVLELERLDLQNQLLKKQIELLEKHSDYRCCPDGMVEEPADE